ncbi:hypothetical protein NC651_002680 [Populus alba x Populus x berolinensis]|nr:hypothetical protein NC651_002680 [Populus alba x Populus x berolinensis]
MKGGAPERLVSGSDDFTMFLWEPAVSKDPKAQMTLHYILKERGVMIKSLRFA